MLDIIFMQHGHNTWIERCQYVHKKSEKYETDQQRRRANAIIAAFYDHQHEVSAYDRQQIFDEPIEDKLTKSAGQLLLWAEMTKPALRQAMKEFKESNKSQSTIGFKISRRKRSKIHKKRNQTKHKQRTQRRRQDMQIISTIPLRLATTPRTNTSTRRTRSRRQNPTKTDTNHPT